MNHRSSNGPWAHAKHRMVHALSQSSGINPIAFESLEYQMLARKRPPSCQEFRLMRSPPIEVRKATTYSDKALAIPRQNQRASFVPYLRSEMQTEGVEHLPYKKKRLLTRRASQSGCDCQVIARWYSNEKHPHSWVGALCSADPFAAWRSPPLGKEDPSVSP